MNYTCFVIGLFDSCLGVDEAAVDNNNMKESVHGRLCFKTRLLV